MSSFIVKKTTGCVCVLCFRGTRRVLWVGGTLILRRSTQITWTTRRLCQSMCHSYLSSDLQALLYMAVCWWWRLSLQGCLPVRHQDVWRQEDSTLQRDQWEGRAGPTVEEDQRGESICLTCELKQAVNTMFTSCIQYTGGKHAVSRLWLDSKQDVNRQKWAVNRW